MPTSPGTDMQSPVPQDTSLFSSPVPRPSGTSIPSFHDCTWLKKKETNVSVY